MESNSPIFKDMKNPLKKIKDKIKAIDLKNIKEKNISIDIKSFIDKGLKNNTYFRNMDSKKKKQGALVAGLIAMSLIGYGIDKNINAGYEVYIGEEIVGAVRIEEDALSLAETLRGELSDKYGHNIVFSDDIILKEARVTNKKLTDEAELKKNMSSSIDILVEGYALIINGEKVGVLNTQRDVDFILEQIKAPYLQKLEEADIKEINILEDIEVSKSQVELREMSNQADLINFIKNGSEEIKTHVVEVGESFWTIAKIYGTTMEELELANPEIEPTRMKPGDEVKLVLPTSKITVEIVRELEYTERLDYEVKVELNDNMFNTQQTTKVEGAYGESFVRANEISHNGIVFNREIIEEKIVKEPVDKVVVRGTKEPPRTMATGAFLMPTRGRLTSPFGTRWGSFHRGIDLANSQGTAILAADGGRVVFSGYQGSYGYMIEIDHENGFRTRYAHCSRLLVGVGDRVYKGQTIAHMGSTGRSTGSHLHFEVIRNGSHQNPSNYVR